MRFLQHVVLMALASIVCTWAEEVSAQHFDVQVQSVNNKLNTGAADFDDNTFTLGLRVWSRYFPTGFASNNPGFNAIGTTTGTPPPGSDALPGGVDLMWDFLPMKVGGYASNLLYWNGVGATPSFIATPTIDFSLSLFGKNNARAAADGSPSLIPGQTIDTTAADGFIHVHRFFFLDNDHDDNNATVAASGVYLIAMRLRMAGLNRSDPYYIVWGTPGASSPSAATLATASTWVSDRADLLSPNFSADFDGDLDVDGNDFLTWQRGAGIVNGALQIQGDANNDHAINAADLMEWRTSFGSSLATFAGVSSVGAGMSVPEPAVAPALGIGLLWLLRLSRRRHGTPLLR
jgi:hypothetical protein